MFLTAESQKLDNKLEENCNDGIYFIYNQLSDKDQ